MKNPYLHFLASALHRLDPIIPRDPLGRPGSVAASPEPVEEASAHEGGAHGELPKDVIPLGLAAWQYAFLLALISGMSMPIGAMLGFKLRPQDTTVARWIALGAGALLFAVAVELYGHSIHSAKEGHTSTIAMIVLMVTSLFGAFFFAWVSTLIGGHGDEEESDDEEDVAKETGAVEPFRWEVQVLCTIEYSAQWPKELAAHMAQHADVNLDTLRCVGKGKQWTFVHGKVGQLVGDSPEREHFPMHVLHHCARDRADVLRRALHHKARGVGAVLRLHHEQQRLIAQKRWAHLREAMKKYHVINYLQKRAATRRDSTGSLQGQFMDNLKSAWGKTADAGPDESELSQVQQNSRKAALTMLTMLLVDGIPEGILMGFMAAAGKLGVTFIISLCIANFPEAFAGGVLMDQGGFARVQILGMWGGLTLMVASLAGISCYTLLWLDPSFAGGHHVPLNIQILVALMEGMAGGAMISGIAACMLPEAYERRDKHGSLLLSGGFLCTCGFLLSAAIKITLD